jgi:uncharacterized repeat protein (TIGR03803 family)
MFSHTSRGAAAFASAIILALALPAFGQTESVLYSFCSQPKCTDGEYPQAGVIMDAEGNLYGTTYNGGTTNLGTVFELTPAGTETAIWNFASRNPDGYGPEAGLTMDTKGNLYGTTFFGNAGVVGGVAFELTPSGTETIICGLGVGGDTGIDSGAGLIMDAKGDLYGTTVYDLILHGERSGGGAVFKLTPPVRNRHTWTATMLYGFCSQPNCTDGENPEAGLTKDTKGNLYGTTYNGGIYGHGTVFELSPNGTGGYDENVIYSFCSQPTCADGANPWAGLIVDAEGNIYSTTYGGGVYEGGTIFELSPNGTGGYNESVLYTFCSLPNCTDGNNPMGALIRDTKGNLYGTTYAGGAYERGTVFQLSPNGTGGHDETVLYSFCSLPNCTDGEYPASGLISNKGNLYGTTSGGGANAGGTVFEVKP